MVQVAKVFFLHYAIPKIPAPSKCTKVYLQTKNYFNGFNKKYRAKFCTHGA